LKEDKRYGNKIQKEDHINSQHLKIKNNKVLCLNQNKVIGGVLKVKSKYKRLILLLRNVKIYLLK
jgi:hypothetical protein